jgi:hypothetical protein
MGVAGGRHGQRGHRRVKVEEKRERREIKGEKIERERKKKQKGIMVFYYFQPSREVVLPNGSPKQIQFHR